MRLNYILSAISTILLGFGLMLLVPVVLALYFHDMTSVMPFVYSALICGLSGFITRKMAGGKQNYNDLRKKEGLFIVTLAWIIISVAASLPFLFFHISPIDALFEGVASITTTGAMDISYAGFSNTLMFWCLFSEWLGGMGVIVLFIAVLPQFAVAGRQMFFAEVPGPTEDKITPRIKQTAIALWGIYVALTLIEIILLKFNGMSLFSSVCNAFSTISASGFSYNQINTAGNANLKLIWISLIFMFLAGVNFSLQYKLYIQRQFKALFQNTEFLTYFYLIIIFSFITCCSLMCFNHYHFVNAIRSALYQVISIITSTGATLTDFANWSPRAKILIFILMLIGGSAGSASGGLKVVRVVIVFKYLWREIKKIIHPDAVFQIKLGKNIVPDDILKQILAFVILYFLMLFLSSVLICIIEGDLAFSVIGSVATLGNISPAYNQNGPIDFTALAPFTKIIFVINMIVGRLELIPFFAMLHKDFWKFSYKKEQ